MGGKALLDQLQTRRYNKAEFERIRDLVLDILGDNGYRADYVRYRREKEDFGDFDCLVAGIISKEEIIRMFNPVAYSKNGCVHSFNVEELQVDLIQHKAEEFECARRYYDNEQGNFMGRVARAFNVKLGHDGLTLPVRVDNTQEIGNLLISNDSKEIFDLLGFDLAKAEAGFDTMADFYQFVIDSKYFNPDKFKFENLNHINRTRNRKRPIYNEFVQLIESGNFKMGEKNYEEGEKRMNAFLEFKGIFAERDRMVKAALDYKLANSRVVDFFRNKGLQDRELGAKMKEVRERFGEQFVQMFLNEDNLKLL